MRKPDAISVPVERFFVIRQENESFRGFGFRDEVAARKSLPGIQKSHVLSKLQWIESLFPTQKVAGSTPTLHVLISVVVESA